MTVAVRCLVFVLGAVLLALLPAPPVHAQGVSADEELAQRYAPIAYVKEQQNACDPHGEPYLPVPVDIVLGDPAVTLRRHKTGAERSDPIVVTAPTARDLAGKDATHYLDLPGNPRVPGCDYEGWSRDRITALGLQPTVYARLAPEVGNPGKLVLQYWFYWTFNDFNNTHESDWEMVQLTFDAGSAAQALTQTPSAISYAQHEGGEHAEWDDEKLRKDGDRIAVYPAAGSHATYYGDAIWLGWGNQGTGFGCDDTDVPAVATPLQVILLPADTDPTGPFAWLLFEGRWGERQPWAFNGPLSPTAGEKWVAPSSWTEGTRPSSLAISGHETIGPGPARFFCAISDVAGSAMTLFPVHPRLIGVGTAAVVIAFLVVASWTWRFVRRAVLLYVRQWRLLVPLSLSLLPVAYASARLEELLRQNGVGRGISNLFQGGNSAVILGLGFSSLQQYFLLGLVAPVIIHATHDLTRHDPVHAREAWGVAQRRLPTTFGALLLNSLLATLMILTVVLIPLAIYRGVQWLYTPHAVTIDGATLREARHVSRRKVHGRWWQTLSMSLLVWLISGIPGPLVANVLLVTGLVPLDVAELVSSVIYAIAFAIAIIASTMYYQRIGDPQVAPPPGSRWFRRSPAAAPAGTTA